MKCHSQIRVAGICSLVFIAAVLACICMIPAQQAHAVTAAEKAAEAESALKELNAMQETLDQASEAYIQALTAYEQANAKCKATQDRIAELSKQIADIQARLGDRARDMYRNGNTSFIDLLLGAASFDELATNWDLLNRVNDNDARLSAQARELRAEQQDLEVVYTEQAAIANQKAEEASEAFHEAEALVEQMQETYDNLSAEAQELYAQEQAAAFAAVTEGGVVNDDGTVTDIQTGQTYESAAAYTSATGNAIVDRARSMIGSAYVWGGVGGSDGGFDCSGLVSYALTGENVRIGTSYTFATYQQVDISQAQAGDLYVTDGHVAVITGDGTVVEAVDEDHGVMERTWNQSSGGIVVRAG